MLLRRRFQKTRVQSKTSAANYREPQKNLKENRNRQHMPQGRDLTYFDGGASR